MRSNILIAAATLSLGACDTIYPHNGSPDPSFGEAVKYDMAVQVIDPDPVYAPEGAQPGDSGAKGAEAVKRYRTDKVKDAKAVTTGGVATQGPR